MKINIFEKKSEVKCDRIPKYCLGYIRIVTHS